jgi:hypothetical protein
MARFMLPMNVGTARLSMLPARSLPNEYSQGDAVLESAQRSQQITYNRPSKGTTLELR